MSIEEIESLWIHQNPPVPVAASPGLRVNVQNELRRRRRQLACAIALGVFGLVLGLTVFTVNTLHAPGFPSAWHWVSLCVVQFLSLSLLYRLYRARQRNRELLRRSGETLQAVFDTALANIEEEMAEYRSAKWYLLAWTFSAMLSAFANFPHPVADWPHLAPRFASILVFMSGICLVAWRHYRKNLVPEQQRLQQTLAELHG
jgi:membrane protein implicated in regulation of membrane protease activity